MNFFYDHQAFSIQDFGGVSRIFSELLNGINRGDNDDHAHLSVLFSNNYHLSETEVAFSTAIKSREIRLRLNQLFNIYQLSTGNYDLYHPTYYDPSLIRYAKKKPVVATFHDMIHERFAHVFPELKNEQKVMNQKRQMARDATHIITVSHNTKKDLVELYGVNECKITVVHLGSSVSTLAQEQNQHNAANPYLLYVGNRGAYKNFMPFLKAIAPILVKNNLKLICAGGRKFTGEEAALISSLNLSLMVNQQSIDDKKLPSLYAQAVAFVNPSLYEGFGIPVLEAFACNCPCVLSNTSSLPEVAGNAAVYMDPDDPTSMVHAVERVVTDTALRKQLITDGRERLKAFSWDKHVTETLNVYHNLV